MGSSLQTRWPAVIMHLWKGPYSSRIMLDTFASLDSREKCPLVSGQSPSVSKSNRLHLCSRLKPSYEFILKGSQISAFQLKGWFEFKMSIQEYRNEMQNSY